jgi:peptidoglycan/LPS O-acetylase OafA/YrhL
LPKSSIEPSGQRLETVDQLRGLAALSVCWFHFTQCGVNSEPFLPDGWVKESGRFGHLGVDIFFVISGFILPWAMARSHYGLHDYPRFLLKRILRLDPPYLVTLALLIGLALLSWARHAFQPDKLLLSFPQVALHLGYLNAFFGYEWLSPIFWTLAIEFQYYVLLGLLFPLLIHRNPITRLSALSVVGALAFLFPKTAFVFHFMFLFLLGISTFYLKVGKVGVKGFTVLLTVIGLGCTWTLGPLIAAVGVVTAMTIAYVNLKISPLRFLGTISYSFYLLHGIVGGIMVAGAMRWIDSPAHRIALLPVMLGLALLASFALYRWVELPAQRWSSAIRYSPRKKAPTLQDLSGSVREMAA